MSIFHRPVVIDSHQIASIDTAYRRAGVPIPTRAVKVQELVHAERTAKEVAAEAAKEALTATDPTSFYEEALDRIRRAHAADALRAAFPSALAEATRKAMPQLLAQATQDLRPSFDKTAKAFQTAAKNLPAEDPLSPDAAIDNDTTKELKAARASLAELGTYAGIYKQHAPAGLPVSLVTLLPLLGLPDCVTEMIPRTPYDNAEPVNKSALSGTYAVRKLATDAQRDMDAALIGVAAGRYKGITFSLATPAELEERTENAANAYIRKYAA